MALLEELVGAFEDASTVALAIEHDLEPVEGPHSPVAPPTYAGEDKKSEFPVSPEAPIPEPNSGGWLSEVRRGDAGVAVTAPSVVLDSVASQAGRAESALWEHRGDLGGLPGFIVSSPVSRDGPIDRQVSMVRFLRSVRSARKTWRAM